jgi:hypothetical protein
MNRGNGGFIGIIKEPTISSASGVHALYEHQENKLSNIWPGTVPDAPTIGTATDTGPGSATVTFIAPIINGGSTITSYTAISSPGNITGTLSQSGSGTITVNGLTPSTSYTFTVYATNAAGNSTSSTASNQITTPTDNIEYIVIGGGGGGGGGTGGGGGAGGVAYNSVTITSLTLNVGYPVSVGSGGSGGGGIYGPGGRGNNSSFNGTTGYGGGGGETNQQQGTSAGTLNGGSGGGGSIFTNVFGKGVYPGSSYISATRQGYDGGGGTNPNNYPAGGGGGASQAGETPSSSSNATAGKGGDGTNAYSVWATATSTGVSGYYAGGGGGGHYVGSSRGAGGAGGGGNNSVVNGTIYTGSGGAGSVGNGSSSGSGGSGIVIIRYAGSQRATGGSITATGGYTYHVFTAVSGTFTRTS